MWFVLKANGQDHLEITGRSRRLRRANGRHACRDETGGLLLGGGLIGLGLNDGKLLWRVPLKTPATFTFAMASRPPAICSAWNWSAKTASIQATDPLLHTVILNRDRLRATKSYGLLSPTGG
jgi:hypothetical protein